MTRKKKRPQPSKRLQIKDSEGWTHVLKGFKNLTITPSTPSHNHFLPVPIPKDLTLQDLQKDHLYYQQKWRDCSVSKNLKQIFTADIVPSSPNTITHCVCLGLGSLTTSRPSPWWELVCLEQILEIWHIPLPQVCIQDPVFNALDKAFFASLNFTVLEDPAAIVEIDQSALLFAPHLEVAVYAKALEKADPGLCVGTDLEHLVDR